MDTPDGLKSIERLKKGDLVYARDDKTGQVQAKPILQVFVERHTDDIRLLTVEEAPGQDVVIVTSDLHPFHTEKGWELAGSLKIGELVDTLDGKKVRVMASEHQVNPQSMYNFEIADFHTYAVSGDKVWVHNALLPCGPKKITKPGLSGKEAARDVPSWAKGQRPYVGENGSQFAERLLNEKYGVGNWSTGAGSEYNQIQKWGAGHL